MAKRLDLRPKFVRVGMPMSGKQPFERRLNFAVVRDEIATEGCPGVAYRHSDRLGRHQLPAELFYHDLEQTKTDLYLSGLGGKVDWRADRMQLLMLGVLGEHEAGQIRDRTRGTR